jgi:hypothetical protein
VAALGLERSIIRLDYSAVSQILGEASLTTEDKENPVNPYLKQLVLKKTKIGLKILSKNREEPMQGGPNPQNLIEQGRYSLTKVLITDRRFISLFVQEPELLPTSIDELYSRAASEENNELIQLLASRISIPTDYFICSQLKNNIQGMKSILQNSSISSEYLDQIAGIIPRVLKNPKILKMILYHPNWDLSNNQETMLRILNQTTSPFLSCSTDWVQDLYDLGFVEVILAHGQLTPASLERAIKTLENNGIFLHSALNISRYLPPSTLLNKVRENLLNARTTYLCESALVYRLLGTSEGRALLYDAIKNDPNLRGRLLDLYHEVLTIGVVECIDSVIRPSLTRLALHPVKVALCTLLATAAIIDFSSKWYH